MELTEIPGWILPDPFRYNGCLFSQNCSVDTLKRVREYDNLKSGDCIVASYPKTGTTLTQEIVWLLYHGGDEKSVNMPTYRRMPFIEYINKKANIIGIDQVDSTPCPRIIKTHLPYDMIPKTAVQNGVKLIYVMRNPKDMLVSYYHFYRANENYGNFPGTFNDFLTLFYKDELCHGFYYSHLKIWLDASKSDNICLVKYEDSLKNKSKEIKRIAEYLEINVTDEIIDNIIEYTDFKTMKKNPNSNYSSMPTINTSVSQFLRRGEIGDWKNHFTVSENEQFDAHYKQMMNDIEIEFDFE